MRREEAMQHHHDAPYNVRTVPYANANVVEADEQHKWSDDEQH